MIADSQIVMICWGAWCPYQNNTFSLSDTISVPLVGGPKPNPDEVLCFRSLLRIRENETDPFTDGRPRITLRFNFAIVGSTVIFRVLLQFPSPQGGIALLVLGPKIALLVLELIHKLLRIL